MFDLKGIFNKYKFIIIAFLALFALAALSGDKEVDDPNMIKIGTSSSSIVGENYQTIITRLETRGFTNIEVTLIEDLILGWLVKDGEIESIEIDGITEFDSSSNFSKDAKIVIAYHTFPKDEPDTVVDDPNDKDPDEEEPDEDPVIVVNHTQEMALRAIIVAFTNRYADDIFTSDGNSIDLSKLHTFEDVSGIVTYSDFEGVWTTINENTWRVEKLSLIIEVDWYQTDATVNADISFDGTNYSISNLTGEAPSYDDISDFEDESDFSVYFVVPQNLVENGREPVVKNFREDIAIRALEIYGKEMYPYGFKTKMFGREQAIEYYDGSWFVRVKVTITNMYGAERETVAEAFINNKRQAVERFRVDD